MNECDIYGGQKYSDLLHIFKGSRPQNPMIYALTSMIEDDFCDVCLNHLTPESAQEFDVSGETYRG